MMKIVNGLIRVIALLVACNMCHASPIFPPYLEANASASAGTFDYTNGSRYLNYDSGEILQTTPISIGPVVESLPGASASVSGSVDYGLIVAGLSAMSAANTSSFSGGADAGFDGSWYDVLTVASPTLAPGTPVNLLFTLTTAGSLSCSGNPANPSAAVADVNNSVGTLAFSLAYSAYAGGGQTPCDGGSMTIDNVQTGILGTTVGAILNVGGAASWTATAAGGANEIQTVADPPDSTTYIDALNSNVTLVSGSGHSYSAPVLAAAPEPGSLALLGTGLLSALCFRRKQAS